MFRDQNFESGCEFKNDLISSIYSRLYLPRNDIIGQGENFTEFIMIQQGVVNVFINFNEPELNVNHNYHFFILPTYSYFGDYQILFDLKSQLGYKAD